MSLGHACRPAYQPLSALKILGLLRRNPKDGTLSSHLVGASGFQSGGKRVSSGSIHGPALLANHQKRSVGARSRWTRVNWLDTDVTRHTYCTETRCFCLACVPCCIHNLAEQQQA